MRVLARIFTTLSIRSQLVLLLTTLAVLLAADRLRLIAADRAGEISRTERLVADLARRGAESQGNVLSETRVLLGMLAHMPETRITTAASCRPKFLQIVAEVPFLSTIWVADTKGNVLCSTTGKPITEGIADRPYFKEALSTGSFVVSDYIVGRATGRPGIITGFPRIEGEEIETLTFGRLSLDWLSRSAGEIAAGPGGRAIVIDSQGTVIAAANDPDQIVGTRIPLSQTQRNALQLEQGVVTSDFLGQGPHIIGHAQLPGTSAAFLVAVPRALALAHVNQMAAQALLKLFVSAAFCVLVVWLGGERIFMRPLARLTEGVRRLGSANESRIDSAGMAPELRNLAHAFNEMSERLSKRDYELRQANARLQELATRDGLTDLANRRHFDERTEAEWNRAARDGKPISLITLDVDHFKRFNDRYGHIAGDECLRAVALTLRSHARRSTDLPARTGGEEFALLLPGANLDQAGAIADSVCRSMYEQQIPHEDSEHAFVTLSIGVASANPVPGSEPVYLIDQADRALYQAKHEGRNRVVTSKSRLRMVS